VKNIGLVLSGMKVMKILDKILVIICIVATCINTAKAQGSSDSSIHLKGAKFSIPKGAKKLTHEQISAEKTSGPLKGRQVEGEDMHVFKLGDAILVVSDSRANIASDHLQNNKEQLDEIYSRSNVFKNYRSGIQKINGNSVLHIEHSRENQEYHQFFIVNGLRTGIIVGQVMGPLNISSEMDSIINKILSTAVIE
jgi:hypothetical protein